MDRLTISLDWSLWRLHLELQSPFLGHVSKSLRSCGELTGTVFCFSRCLDHGWGTDGHDTSYVTSAEERFHAGREFGCLAVDCQFGDAVHQFHLVRARYLI